ncbi:sugar phosphate isomerase/epimerase family protein [Petroclostridium sp. X23]|uniref:sugar phosphate isomerase/epimerase family protein n=1 Tax=Petroclostridium sp. X23 TaxID=3045146 RepID=UPI0024AD5764|nr:sugar phosphate isomerase/epimerase family protein [Petroclostridium sp. X23]WHH60835.1 sugar phosphate isomerase/epimerase family protein [Petroclostridium sp. X23]
MARIKKSRIAIGNYHYVRYHFTHFLNTAVKLGIENIEVWAAAPHFCLDTLNEKSLLDTKHQIEDRGLKVVCVTPEQCSYPINIAAEEFPLRTKSIQYFKTAIDAAAELNAPYVLVTAGCGYFDADIQAAWERSLAGMKELVAYAECKNITLAYEPLSKYSSNLVNNVFQLQKMLESIPSNHIKGMLDTGQMALAEEDIHDYPRLLGDKLAHVHLLDATPMGHLALGEGRLPLGEYIDVLEDSGYKGWYTFEFTALQYRHEPEIADEKSINWLLANDKLIIE